MRKLANCIRIILLRDSVCNSSPISNICLPSTFNRHWIFNVSLKWAGSWWTWSQKRTFPGTIVVDPRRFSVPSSPAPSRWEEGAGPSRVSAFWASGYKRAIPVWPIHVRILPSWPDFTVTLTRILTQTHVLTITNTSTCGSGAPTRVSASRLVLADITDRE